VCQHAGSALLAAAADDLVIRMCARLPAHPQPPPLACLVPGAARLPPARPAPSPRWLTPRLPRTLALEQASRAALERGSRTAEPITQGRPRRGFLVPGAAAGSPVRLVRQVSGPGGARRAPEPALALSRYDYEAARLVRRFRGHADRVTDLALAADARWLLSASLDGSLRVWDVPAAVCLQARSRPAGRRRSPL